MIEGNGSTEQTKRSLKKNSAGDVEALNFVAKYMGEINSVVLEKLHVSEEMKDFFENYENLSDSQKVKFKKYWENPDIKELRSLVMSSTIKFFLDVYGADGNNEDFRDLIEYAHSIKPNRIKAQEEHNRLQAEYEEIFKDYYPEEILTDNNTLNIDKEPEVVEEKSSDKIFQEKLEQKSREINGKIYTYKLSSGTKISIVGNYENMLKEKINDDMKFLPKAYKDEYCKYLYNEGLKDPKYFLSFFYNVEGLSEVRNILTSNVNDDEKDSEFELFKKEHMYTQDEVVEITKKISDEYNRKHSIQGRAIEQILTELLFSIQPTTERFEELTRMAESDIRDENPELTDKEVHSLALKNVHLATQKYMGKNIVTLQISEAHRGLETLGADPIALKPIIDKKYAIYNKPLTPKENQMICAKIINNLTHYDPSASILDNDRSKAIMYTISKNLNAYPSLKKALTKTLFELNVLPNKNGDYRAFLLNDSNKEMLKVKSEIFFVNYLNANPDAMMPLLSIDKTNMDKYIAPVDSGLYNELVKFRVLQRIRTGR